MIKKAELRRSISIFTLLVITSFFLGSGSKSNPKQRIRFSINENEWKFKREEVKNGFGVSLKDSDWLSIKIPHDYNGGSDGKHNDVFLGRFDTKNDGDMRLQYTGPGWYRTTFLIGEQHTNKRVFIEFEAVSLEAKVWVNGKEVGMHRGGYTAFSFDITDHIRYGKPNLLAVRADNSNNPKIAPWMNDEKKAFPFSFDYAVYGGIYRDVWISITDHVKIEKVFNTATIGGQSPASLTIETRVKNYAKNSREVTLSTSIYDPADKLVSTLKSKKTIKPGEQVSFSQMESVFGDLKLWDVNDPKLYKVYSTVSYDGKVVDDFESVFGFRYFTLANNQAFSLNDRKFLIRGVNRHQDMEGLGYALPNLQHLADAKLIKEAGFNFVRHAHYPSDSEFTKACDELGLMLWLEIPLTGSTSEDPDFLQNCKQQLTEMIEQHYNNPSVIIWGIGNESDRSGADEAATNRIFSELIKTARSLDETRTLTGCNYKFESNQKIAGTYAPQDWSGWYSGNIADYNPNSIIGEYGADMHLTNHSEEKFDIKTNYNPAQKPDFWSQEYGSLVHEYKVSYGEAHKEQFPGHFAWVAFDFASPRVDRGSNPIPFMNQKGLVMHDHKTKKDAYYFYQSMYREAKDLPLVYIVSPTWSDRWKEPGIKNIWVYSNCDSVELYNGFGESSLGRRIKNAGPRGDTRFEWDQTQMKTNVLYAEGWYKNKIVARDTILLKNLPERKK
jgi:beta-galactosidase